MSAANFKQGQPGTNCGNVQRGTPAKLVSRMANSSGLGRSLESPTHSASREFEGRRCNTVGSMTFRIVPMPSPTTTEIL